MTKSRYIFLIVLTILIVVGSLGRAPFKGTITEGRRSEISAMMVSGHGDLMLPHSAGKATLTKPPFFYWAQAASFSLFGVNEFGARLPSALAALLVLLLVYEIARNWRDQTAGWLAVLFCCSNYTFMQYARLAEIDMSLLLFITAAVYFLQRFFTTGTRRDQLGFWLCCGIGFMVKGPHALMFPLFGLSLTAIVYRKKDPLKLKQFFHLYGPLLMLLIIVPWYAYIITTVPDVMTVLKGETIDRFAKGAAHQRPIWYYFFALPTLFPWLLAAIPAGFYFWKRRDQQGIYLSCYIVVNLLILSLISSKKIVYLLPLVPIVSILAAGWLSDLPSKKVPDPKRRWFKVVSAVIPVLGMIIPVALLFRYHADLSFSGLVFDLLTFGLSLYLLLKADLFFKGKSQIYGNTALVVALLLGCWFQIGLPVESRRKTYKKFAFEVSKELENKTPVYQYKLENYSLYFYLGLTPDACPVDRSKLKTGDLLLTNRAQLPGLALSNYKIVVDIQEVMKGINRARVHDLVLIKVI